MADLESIEDTVMDLRPPHPNHCERIKEDGSRCRAYKVSGLTECPAHSGVALKNLDPAKAQQASARVRKERNRVRKLTPKQRLEEQAAEHEQAIVARLIEYATGEDVNGTHQLRAIALLFDRLYGKPEQKIEHVQGIQEELESLGSAVLADYLTQIENLKTTEEPSEES